MRNDAPHVSGLINRPIDGKGKHNDDAPQNWYTGAFHGHRAPRKKKKKITVRVRPGHYIYKLSPRLGTSPLFLATVRGDCIILARIVAMPLFGGDVIVD